MNEQLNGRLYNCKFTQACAYLEGEPEEVVELVQSLSRVFGDVGWSCGDMAIIVYAAVKSISGYKEDEE